MVPALWTGGRAMSAIVVGLDLSLTSTGIAIAEGNAVDVQRIRSTGPKGAPTDFTADRIATIAGKILTEVTRDPVDLIVIEGPSFGSTGNALHQLGGLWWHVVIELHMAGHGVAVVSPQTRAKYATGKGGAGKDEVLAAVVRRYPDVDVTGNDVADAVVLAAMGCRWLGRPVDDLPKVNLAAMDGAKWPATAPALTDALL